MYRNMTEKWASLADSVTRYVIERRSIKPNAEEDYTSVYNDWIHKSAIEVHDAELSYWCLSHIEYLYNLPMSILRECI